MFADKTASLFYLLSFISLLYSIASGQELCTNLCPTVRVRSFVGVSTVELNWEPFDPPNGNQYIVEYRLRNSGDYIDGGTTNGAGNSTDAIFYNLTGLASNTDYDVRVCLFNSPNECGNCLLCVTSGTIIATEVPSPPISLTGHPENSFSIVLEWQQPNATIENVHIYHITYAAQNGSDTDPRDDTSGTTLKTITPLSPNTHYGFLVQAENSVGLSDPSEIIFVTTPPQSVTPGFLLYSDATSVYFYYTDESSASTGTSNLATPLLALNGISGIGYQPLNNYTYTSLSNRTITRYYTDRQGETVSLSNGEVVLQRSQDISLITVDWLNNMMYWQEVVNNTHCTIMRSMINGGDVDCISTPITCVSDIEVDPVHGYFYWSILAPSPIGGIFQVDLSAAASGDCSSPLIALRISSIATNYSMYGVNAMALGLDADLLFYISGSELLSYSLVEDGATTSYPHESQSFPVGARSLVSYNDYLAFSAVSDPALIIFAKFRELTIGNVIALVALDDISNQLYMIREELQPFPAPPGPVNMVNYYPNQTVVNFTWSAPQYDSNDFGPSAFSRWTYHLSIQPGGDDVTVDNEFSFTNLAPNTVYFISILPRGLKNNGDASETTTWLVQTLDEVNPIPTVILASDTGIYTAVTNDGQLVRLSDEDNRDQDSIGVAYDSHRNIFYWAIDGGATRLRQLTGGDTESSELSLVANPSSVALDYIGQRLYWIEEIRENGGENRKINYQRVDSDTDIKKELFADEGIADMVVDSPNGLLFWAHNGRQSSNITVMKLNGLGGRIMCTSGTSVQYLAIALDTVTMRIFWVRRLGTAEPFGGLEVGTAEYSKEGGCSNPVNRVMNNVDNLFARLSMTYVVGSLFFTSSAQANTVCIGPSNFSSASANYQLAFGCYNVFSGSRDVEIRAIISNETSQQFLPDNVELDGLVEPDNPSNLRLDDSSTPTVINITWDRSEGISPAIITYQLIYSLSRVDGSSDSDVVMTSDNYYVLENQSPETTLNISVRAFTRWYSSGATELTNVISPSRLPSQIEQSSASVYRMERNSNQLSVLFTWAGLDLEQAGGVLLRYVVTLTPTGGMVVMKTVSADDVLLVVSDLSPNQEYSFTVRGVNRAGSGEESEEITFNTNAPQPPMELLATVSSGTVNIISRDSQSPPVETGFTEPFVVDSRTATVYYVESSQLKAAILRNPNSARVLMTLSSSVVNHIELDWVGRRLYLTYLEGGTLIIHEVSLDSLTPPREILSMSVADVTMVDVTLSPYAGLLYWVGTRSSSSILSMFNLYNETSTLIFDTNSVKRNVMCTGGIGARQLTAALTYDVITNRIWVSTVTTGHIWSCDLTGCNCIVEVNATTLVAATNGASVMSDVGLPANSISLDNVNIYWSSSSGVFSVPRDDTTTLSQLSNTTTSSLVTIDPGQQPLPVESCLYPAVTVDAQPMTDCGNSTSDTLSVSWTEPQITPECQNQLYTYPTLTYRVIYQVDNLVLEEDTFTNPRMLTNLFSFVNYTIRVVAFNNYNEVPNNVTHLRAVTCATGEGRPSPVRDLRVIPIGTTILSVSWRRPIARGSADGFLSYTILRDGMLVDTVNNTVTVDTTEFSRLILGLASFTSYVIQVTAANSIDEGQPIEMIQSTFPLPPSITSIVPSNTSVQVQLNLVESHRLLSICFALTPMGGTEECRPLPDGISYTNGAVVLLGSLQPVTNYTLRVRVDYPSTEVLYSDNETFTTASGVPGIPVITLNNGILNWTKPPDNGAEITGYNLRVVSSSSSFSDELNSNEISNLSLSIDLREYRRVSELAGQQVEVSINAVNSVGGGNYSNSLTYAVPGISSSPGSGLATGVLIGIIAGVVVFVIVVLILLIILCYCYRVRPKNYDYAFRVEVPYDMELRKLRLNQMRMANNDLYSPNYNPDDVETLKKFPRDRIKLEKLLGRGAFGEVWAGTALDIMGQGTGLHPVALKTLQKNATESDQRSFLSEAIVMSNFDHPNVLPVLGVCLNNNPFYLILELMEAGDLLAFLRGARQENGPPLLTLPELVKVSLDVANGAKYLETQHFVHRDLAARNCLVSSKGPDRVVKIGDFGLARDVYHSDYYRKEGQGLLPVRWMAPESLLDGKFTVDSDIWSYGILLWEITTLGRQPYPARSNQEVFQFVIGGGRCDKPDNCHPKLYRLMRQCWAHRPEERPRFTVIVDTLTRLQERLADGTEFSSDDSEFEEDDETEPRYTIQTRGSGGRRSLRSSIRSGASNVVSGIVNLTRAGSMRLRNSIRRQGSIRRQDEVNEARGGGGGGTPVARPSSRGRAGSTSEQQLLDQQSNGSDHLLDSPESSQNGDGKEQNGFREIGPF